MAREKRTKKEINFRKLTRNTSWISIVVIVIVSIFIYVGIAFSAAAFGGYIINTKLDTEFESAQHMADVLKSESISEERAYELLDRESRDYYVIDTLTGEVIHSKGEVRRFAENEKVLGDFINAGEKELYTDTDLSFFRIDEDNDFDIDSGKFFQFALNKLKDVKSSNDLKAEILNIPVWMKLPVGENREMFTRMALVLKVSDFTYAALFFTAVGILVMIAELIVIVNTAASMVRRRHTLNLLFKDMVTNGKNRLWFSFYGNRLIRKKKYQDRKYAVVSLKLLNYTNFCISHSLTEGEEMLRKISETISASIGRREICSHTSSATFALLLKYTDEESMRRRVKDIIGQLEGLNTEHRFSFHAGVTVVDVSQITETDAKGRKLIDIDKEYSYAGAARDTLSSSDESGVAFLDEKLIEEQKWVDTVYERQESALKNEEFKVYYQPKYNPQTDELSGAEALIRWESPEFGFVTPNRIIPIFEKNGFITEIDHYMITHVARDQKRWLDMGLKCVPVSVNVSRAHFIEETLAEQIRDMVDAENCPHEYVEIELTESAFFDDKKAMLSTINKLKGYGFAVSMDDFGSGYSSLNSLKDMPLDVLKLDAEFFRGEQDDDRRKKVVSEAIKLAKLLDMRTVAEGVESKEDVEFLAGEKCDMIQGYYYAKPEPGNAFEERMRA